MYGVGSGVGVAVGVGLGVAVGGTAVTEAGDCTAAGAGATAQPASSIPINMPARSARFLCIRTSKGFFGLFG